MPISRTSTRLPDGTYSIHVKPPAGIGRGRTVILTQGQYQRYLRWLDTNTPIQRLLYDISASDREALMTGLNDDEWDARQCLHTSPTPSTRA